MEKVMNVIYDIWAIGLVRFIVYLGIGFLAGFVAAFIVTYLLSLLKLDKKLEKIGVNEGAVGTSMSLVGKLVFLIVFLMFLPQALGALGITNATGPINNFVSTFVRYIPNLIAAAILIYVGIFLAQIIGQLVNVLLKKTKIDALIKTSDEQAKVVLLSDVIVKIVMSVIILITIVQALLVLGINAISGPALSIVYSIFNAIPSIILAVVVIACGLLVTGIACSLLGNVLLSVNFDSIVKKVLPQLKVSATKTVVNIVRCVIILFVFAQGIEALNLSILIAIVVAIVSYLPMVIKALIIAVVAFIGASMLEAFIAKAAPKAACVSKIAKVAIFTVAGFMILSQLGIATDIVNTAFVITLAAIAVSFALAFGLGGKDFAKKTLDRVDEKIDQCKNDK